MKDLTGYENEHFKVLEFSRVTDSPMKRNRYLWLAQCKYCPNKVELNIHQIMYEPKKSCGCQFVASRYVKHGECKGNGPSRIHKIHHSMLNRCNLLTDPSYPGYGGRGITVCPEWSNKETGFINFLAWALSNGYDKDLQIERTNNNGNYEPSNCEWKDRQGQARNRRSNHIVNIWGREMCLQEAIDKYATVGMTTICSRFKRGWDDVEAVILPSLLNTKFKRSRDSWY